MMFNHHPAFVRVLQQDRYYRLLNERRRGATHGCTETNDTIGINDTTAPRVPKAPKAR